MENAKHDRQDGEEQVAAKKQKKEEARVLLLVPCETVDDAEDEEQEARETREVLLVPREVLFEDGEQMHDLLVAAHEDIDAVSTEEADTLRSFADAMRERGFAFHSPSGCVPRSVRVTHVFNLLAL